VIRVKGEPPVTATEVAPVIAKEDRSNPGDARVPFVLIVTGLALELVVVCKTDAFAHDELDVS
jgi:hypothetical protein